MDSIKFLSQLNAFFSNFLTNLLGPVKNTSIYKGSSTIIWEDITLALSNVGNIAAAASGDKFKELVANERKILSDLKRITHFFGMCSHTMGKNKAFEQVSLIVGEIYNVISLFIKTIKAEDEGIKAISAEKLVLAQKSLDLEIKQLEKIKAGV